jgi:ATP-dependent helicase HrpB
MIPLPIDDHLPAIQDAVRSKGAVVVVAPPGAGKTTRVPPVLAQDGPLIVLQPRRVAARSLARRIAQEQGWTLGEEVGWQVRFERRFSRRTRLLLATEGILTARLQADPLLSDFRTVILDEFHERSLHADLALALVKQAAQARGDLRLVVMSATLDAQAVARFLGGCSIIQVAGRLHPVEVAYRPGATVAQAARELAPRTAGHLLCFLPGAPEIRRAGEELAGLTGRVVLPLHGSLSAEEQDLALAPSSQPKIILATNLAETSLTVEGVTDIIDSGLQKVVRYDAERGLDRLQTERIGQDSAEQRAGRAGRTGPGRALRLWDPREKLATHREPEIARVDLGGPLLEVVAWGGDPLEFDWFEPPPREAVGAALELLERLGALRDRRLTPEGERMHRLSLHPRLSRVLLAAGGSFQAAAACAVLSERVPAWSFEGTSTPSDVLSLVDRLDRLPRGIRQAAEQIATQARSMLGAEVRSATEDELLRALLAGFPDRVAKRREPGSPRLLLASGYGAVLARESGVREGEFVLALEVAGGPQRGPASEGLVRLASRVEKEWLRPTRRVPAHEFDEASGSVRAVERTFYESLVLSESPMSPDPEEATALLVAALGRRGLGEAGETLRRRLAFAGIVVDFEGLCRRACWGVRSLSAVDLDSQLPFQVRRDLDRLAPLSLAVPSGRSVRLEYREDGAVVASVKLQELFGLAETPRLGPRQEPVLLELLAPSGRPVQTTRDLKSFWERTYPEVRKELRGRYPKHPWPEDPWTAEPTARAKRRGGGPTGRE